MQSNRKYYEFLAQEKETQKEKELFRELHLPQGIDFCSNDSLSLNKDFLPEIYRNLVHRGSIGSTGSRLIRGQSGPFEELENVFASFAGHEGSLYFSSGYAAALGVGSALFSPADQIFCDRLLHASLLDAVRLSGAGKNYFRHNNLEDLENKLKKRKKARHTWIVTESYFSMDGDSPDLAGLVKLAATYDCLLLLDEAHAIGAMGPLGRGLGAQVRPDVTVTIYPCGKALGLCGAFVGAHPLILEQLIQRARSFVFSTAPPLIIPLLLKEVVLALAKGLEERRRQLAENVRLFRSRIQSLADTRGSYGHIIPIIAGTAGRALKLSALLRSEGFDVRAIRPPTVPDELSRLRISLQSGHTDAELNDLEQALERSLSSAGP
ncbi:MAG: 8-amino-7-oxononanoate synthase [Spirochaetales bacterium]|nr:8-amino-7-oxononanoate synthase [Spirochaetales bacterium]